MSEWPPRAERTPWGAREAHKPHYIVSSRSAEEEYFATMDPTIEDIYEGAGLTPRQRFVIDCRVDYNMTLEDIATLMGVRRQTVWEIETAAKKKLEKSLTKHPDMEV